MPQGALEGHHTLSPTAKSAPEGNTFPLTAALFWLCWVTLLPSVCQETTKKLENLGAAKDALQKECETYLSKKPSSTSASQLPVTLNALRSKYSDVKMLSSLYNEK